MKKNFLLGLSTLIALTFVVVSCTDTPGPVSKDITKSEKVSVDRFSDAAGILMKRSALSTLPAANAPIDLDNGPFITVGLDKDGKSVTYYNFDVQSTTPDDIYVFFKKDGTKVVGQNNVIPTIPGDVGYNDFWIVNKVTVPDNYVVNSITSEDEVKKSGYTIEKTKDIVNCPVVPFGSTAGKSSKGGASALTIGWYKGKQVAYFSFEENLTAGSDGSVPVSDIYVIFKTDGDPSSGFKTETANPSQTHNVIETSPGDALYSPLWDVNVISNAHFDHVTNLATAKSFPSTRADATVNCPVVH